MSGTSQGEPERIEDEEDEIGPVPAVVLAEQKTSIKKRRGRPKGSKNKATARRLFFSQGLAETEDMMELVDGSGNDNGIVENRGGSEPNRNGRSMTENGSAPEERPLSGRHWGRRKFCV